MFSVYVRTSGCGGVALWCVYIVHGNCNIVCCSVASVVGMRCRYRPILLQSSHHRGTSLPPRASLNLLLRSFIIVYISLSLSLLVLSRAHALPLPSHPFLFSRVPLLPPPPHCHRDTRKTLFSWRQCPLHRTTYNCILLFSIFFLSAFITIIIWYYFHFNHFPSLLFFNLVFIIFYFVRSLLF